MSDNTVTADDLTFAEFPAASREEWLALVSGVLKGASFEQRLVSKTSDGLAIAPLYARGHGAQAVPGRRVAAPWRIVQRIELPDAVAANAQALHDVENGSGFAVTPRSCGCLTALLSTPVLRSTSRQDHKGLTSRGN
jgi:hypothetical protein